MASNHANGQSETIENEEHRSVNGVNGKAVIPYYFNSIAGTLTPAAPAFVPFAYDYKALTQNSTQDIWTYKSGGSGGTLVATKTITYTDSTKVTISTIVRT